MIPGSGAKLVSVHKGLSHPFSNEERFEQELWNEENLPIHGYRFFAKPEAVSPEFERNALEILSRPGSYESYTGPKMCGGYHADFALTFDDAGVRKELLVCFGCQEVLMYAQGRDLICELEISAARRLVAAWGYREGYDPAKAAQMATRLSVDQGKLSDWGLSSKFLNPAKSRKWHFQVWEKRRFGSPRIVQQVVASKEKISGTSKNHFFILVEESYASPGEAAKRAEGFRVLREDYTKENNPEYFFRDGFAKGSKFYFVATYKEESEPEIARVLARLRDYCEEKPLLNLYKEPIPE